MSLPHLSNELNINPAIDALHRHGLQMPINDQTRNGLTIGLLHDSFLYEHVSDMPHVTPGLLAALAAVGKSFAHRASAVYLYQNLSFDKPGPMSDRVAHIASSFHSWAGSLQWLSRSMAVGKSLNRVALPPRVPSIVCHQLIGTLCLNGLEDVANGLLHDLISTSTANYDLSAVDPTTMLLETLGRAPLETRVEMRGPDHAPRFLVTLTDPRGRQSEGEGLSKKQATRAASADFLQKYLPRAIAEAKANAAGRSSQISPLPITGHEYKRHAGTVRSICDIFGAPGTAEGILSQALIHSSWVYENRALVARTHQQDNQILGLVGSHVLNYECILRIARSIEQDPPPEFYFLTPERKSFELGFYHLGLADALLMGRGQESMGTSLEMASNCFQAVIGAIYLSKQCPRSLLTDWPARLSRLRDITIPEVPRSQDPVTTLQEICAISQLTPSYAAEVSGPAHGQTSRSTLTIDSNAMRRRIRVIGGSVRGGKRPANMEAASIVLEVIDQLSDEVSIRDVGKSGSNNVRIATFLVSHLATVVPDSETMTRKWMNARLFGTQLVRKPSALMAWAAGADRLLGPQAAGSPNAKAITQLYRWAISISADQLSPIRRQLASMLQRMDSFGEPEDITNDDIAELALLCDVYRARGSKLPNVAVASLSEDWAVLYGPRIQVSLPVEQITLTGTQRAALDSLSSLLLKQSGTVTIKFDQGFPVHIHMHGDSGRISRQVSAACSLWSAYDPMLDITSVEHGVDVSVSPISPDGDPGTVLGCVAAALQPVPEPENSAIADLLHDLKNQLVAAKQALAAPSSSRTAQLAARASASRHLDQAVSMGRRLGAVSSLLGPPGADAAELRSFMRQYSMSVLSRLPETISFVLPATAGDPVRVALDEASLTAILDNLIKNGIEAMPSGGTIKLDWTSDFREAVIEVSDDGPGLPDAVADALESGAAVASTKPGGNGLGLRSVKTLLRRAGGEVAVSNTFGTTWLLSIPLAIEVDAVEEN